MFNSKSTRSKGYDQAPSYGGFFRRVGRVMSFTRGPSQSQAQIWDPPPSHPPVLPQTGPSVPYGQYYSQSQHVPHYPQHRPRHNSRQPSYSAPPPRRDEPIFRGPEHPPNFSGPQPRPLPPPQPVPLREYHGERRPNPDYIRRGASKPHSAQAPQYSSHHYNQPSYPRNTDYSSPPTRHPYRPDPQPPPRPTNNSNDYPSSSARQSYRSDPRPTNAGHTPYFDPPDFLRNPRDSAGSLHESLHHGSGQRPRTNPYANTPRTTPWQSNASLPRTEESGPAPSTRSRHNSSASQINPASQSRTSLARPKTLVVVNADPKYDLAPELKIRSGLEYPWILYRIWQGPVNAEVVVAQRESQDLKRRTLAFNLPVYYIRIKSYKRGDPLSIAIACWGDIEVGKIDATKPISVRDILLQIWDYFQTPIQPHEWAEFEKRNSEAQLLAIEASYEQRQSIPNTGVQMPATAREGASRVDTLWRYWMFSGLALDKDFEENHVVRLKVSHYGAYDDR